MTLALHVDRLPGCTGVPPVRDAVLVTEGARVVACGRPITIAGGRAWMMGGEADGPDALRRKAHEMAKPGADPIKVMATGGGTSAEQGRVFFF